VYKYFVEEWKVTDEYCEGKIRYRLNVNGQVDVLTMKDAENNVFLAPRCHLWIKASNRIHDLKLNSLVPGEKRRGMKGTILRIADLNKDFHVAWLDQTDQGQMSFPLGGGFDLGSEG
jgi:hypothetical protein